MKIRAITISELDEFIRSDEFLSMDPLPITPERTKSQRINPYALPNEPVLWIAHDDNGKLIGFIGSLPAYSYRGSCRMGWNSCWWVDPEYGKDAAMPLFYTFLKHWDMKVAFSDMTANTRSIVDLMDFCYTREEKLFIGYIKLSAKSVYRSMYKFPRPLLILLSAPFINFLQLIRMSIIGTNLRGMEMEVMEHADSKIFNFIGRYAKREFSQRGEKEFNWMLRQGWLVKSSDEAKVLAKKYPFSYLCDDFKWRWIVTRNEKQINSVMLVSIRDGALKVLYYYGDVPGFALLALKLYISNNSEIRKIVFSHPDLVANSRMLNSILLFRKSKIRYTGISKKLVEDHPNDLVMQLGDGDAAFT